MSGAAGSSSAAGRVVLANFAWLIFDRAGRALINVVAGVAVARHLGPGDFGVLSFATSLAGLFAVVTGLGLDEILVRDLVDPARSGGTWRAAWRLRLGAAWLAFAGAIAVAILARPGEPRVWLIAGIVAGGMIFGPADLVDLWFQARSRMRPPAVARQVALWTAAALRLLLVALDAPLIAFAWAVLAEAAIVAGALGWLYRGEKEKPAPGDAAGHGRRLLQEGWPLLASGFLVMMTMQSDRLLLGRIAGDAEVGLYAAAARLTEVLHALPLALGAAVMPRLVALHRADTAAYWQLARRTVLGAAAATFVAAAMLTLLAPWIIGIVFGRRYAGASDILAIHGWTLVFVTVVSLRTRLLVIAAGTGWVLIMSLLTAALNLVANLVLIPRYGGVGAAWAAASAWAFSALIVPCFFPVTRELMWQVLGGKGAAPRATR